MDFLTDLNSYLKVGNTGATEAKHSTNKKAGTDLQMDDYLKLMIATFQNQSIDDVASTSDMVNQMVQMSVIQTITSLNQIVSESSSLTYAASLVGKEVTVGQRNGDQVSQFVGKVTGTGVLDGEHVIFIGDRMFNLSDVIAVGRVPSSVDATELNSVGSGQSSDENFLSSARNADDQPSDGGELSFNGSNYVDTSGFEYVQDDNGTIRIIYTGEDGVDADSFGVGVTLSPASGVSEQAAAVAGTAESSNTGSADDANADGGQTTVQATNANGLAEGGNEAAAEEQTEKD